MRGAGTPNTSAELAVSAEPDFGGRTSRSGGTGWRPTSTTCGPRWPGAPALRPSDEDAEHGLRLAGALWYFWFQRGSARRGTAMAHPRARQGPYDRS